MHIVVHKVGGGAWQLASVCNCINFFKDKTETSKGWLNPVEAGRASVLVLNGSAGLEIATLVTVPLLPSKVSKVIIIPYPHERGLLH